MSFFSAIVCVGESRSGINFCDACEVCVVSRKGLLETGRDDEGWTELRSSKGEDGLLGKGDAARFRKGLFEDRLMLKPGDG